MSKFFNRTIYGQIDTAIKAADKLLVIGSPMMNEIMKKNDFEYDSGSGMEVMTKIASCTRRADVFTYKSKLPWSKALGYSNGKDIYINTRKLDSMNMADVIGLLIHEWLHFGPGFSHGNNYKTEHKCKHSVNYFCSENVARWL